MAGCCAEADAPVWLGAEVTAVEAVAVEIDEPAASRALSSPLPEIDADAAHAFNVGAVDCRGLISLDPSAIEGARGVLARPTLRPPGSPIWLRCAYRLAGGGRHRCVGRRAFVDGRGHRPAHGLSRPLCRRSARRSSSAKTGAFASSTSCRSRRRTSRRSSGYYG